MKLDTSDSAKSLSNDTPCGVRSQGPEAAPSNHSPPPSAPENALAGAPPQSVIQSLAAQTPPRPSLSLAGLPASFSNGGATIVDAVISDPEKIYIDLDTYESIVWPTDELKERGGLDGWPLWGWVGTLGGRRARIVHVWGHGDRAARRAARGGRTGGGGPAEKKECRHVGLCVKNCADGVEGRTVVLVEVDGFYVPIQADGLQPAPEDAARRARAAAGEDVWDEAEMRPSVGRCARARSAAAHAAHAAARGTAPAEGGGRAVRAAGGRP
jgi:hypothetical protein